MQRVGLLYNYARIGKHCRDYMLGKEKKKQVENHPWEKPMLTLCYPFPFPSNSFGSLSSIA